MTGYFDYLRIERATTGQAAFDEQQRMATSFASKYPSVTQRSGLEVSAGWPHLNWFGSGIQLPDYASNHQPYPTFLAKTVVPAIHSSGGLASYNHPFGYTAPPELSQAQQQSMVRKVSSQLLANRLLGVDILEVGYRLRAGVDVSHHLALWDVLSRNSVFLTGNGTTDDHAGTNWAGIHNNWVTTAWAKSVAMTDLLAALAGGRAFCGSLSAFRGTLDLLVDGTVPMGAVSVSKVLRRTLAATATGVPAGGTLQILQGDVDYAGQSGLYANTKVIGSYPASSLGAGRVTKVVDTAQGSFLRSQVLDRTGTVIAASNPVWLLTSAPPDGIPAARQT